MILLRNYPAILTIEDAMLILKIGRGQIYTLLQSGKLKGFKIGSKTWKIPTEAVEEFINTNGYSNSLAQAATFF